MNHILRLKDEIRSHRASQHSIEATFSFQLQGIAAKLPVRRPYRLRGWTEFGEDHYHAIDSIEGSVAQGEQPIIEIIADISLSQDLKSKTALWVCQGTHAMAWSIIPV